MPSAQAPSAHRVMLDEAHHNVMATATGGYRPLVQVLTDAGFDVTPNTLPFRPDRLATTDVVVVANPNGAGERAPTAERATSAFTDSEIDAVEEWVRRGGGLLLVTDQYPTGAAAQRLAERFDVKLSGGWTDDPSNRWPLPGYGPVFGHLVFSLENGLLPDHPITRGSDDEEKIEGVSTITGGSMEGPPGSTSLLLWTGYHPVRLAHPRTQRSRIPRHKRRAETSIRARRATRFHRAAAVKVSRSPSVAAGSSSLAKWAR
jgi:hypothetical protein